jgi:hypothetical protein
MKGIMKGFQVGTLIRYYHCDQIKEGEVGGICSTHNRIEKHLKLW